ncbi:MAG: All-trans-zeta-carotene desaturase [Verrucomicrobiota bacterium]|jgi:phytoene desaturase
MPFRHKLRSAKEVVVVGAGPGGLAVSILLAAAGMRVTVLEKMDTVGGRTSSLEADGFRFDLGPTFFLYPRVLDEILQVAGTSLRQEVEMIRLDPQYRVMFGAGGQIDATPKVAEMERQIAALCPADASGFSRFLRDNREKFGGVRSCLERPFLGWKSLLAKEVLSSAPYIRPWESVEGYLRRFFTDERVRLAFSFQSKYLGMSPFRCPSLFSILSYLEYDYGVWHPVGGCGEVSAAMARVARRLGVDIRLSEPVEELIFDGRRVVGARTLRGRYRADAVVTNADFGHAMQKLVPDAMRSRWSDKQLAKKQFSCSTMMLYLGVEGSYEHMPHHTIHISKGYRRNLEEIEDLKVLPTDPSFYVQNACVSDPSLARPGTSTIYLLVPVPHQTPHIHWPTAFPAFRRQVLKAAEMAGFEGLESRIRFEKVVTPDDWEHTYSVHRGATFNLAHTLTQMLHLRPRNRFEDVDGMYLVGGGTHPGSGLPVIYEGARITAQLLCEDLGMSLPVPFAQTSEHRESLSHWEALAAKVATPAPGV